MRDEDRGKIRNRQYAQQIKDFSGLRFGKITPTDIDGFLDFDDKVFIFIEIKHGKAQLKYGQKLALERLCDAACSPQRKAIVMVASHGEDGDIKASELLVTQIRIDGQWRNPKKEITVREAIEQFLKWAKFQLNVIE